MCLRLFYNGRIDKTLQLMYVQLVILIYNRIKPKSECDTLIFLNSFISAISVHSGIPFILLYRANIR